MKIRYEFVTGETVEIEVPETIGELAIAIDKDIRSSDRRETRRHNSVEELVEQGRHFWDGESSVEEAVMKNEEHELLHKAIKMLLPQQRDLVQKVFLEGRTMADIAREEGINVQAVQNRISKIKARLRKIIEKN